MYSLLVGWMDELMTEWMGEEKGVLVLLEEDEVMVSR